MTPQHPYPRSNLGVILEGRAKFVQAYCTERDWDPNNLSMTQVFEIRDQQGWKTPLEASA